MTGTLGTGVSLEVTGALSEAVWSDLTEDAELGDNPSSSLGLLGAPSGVCERDDPGLDRGGLGADRFFHWLRPSEEL